jgi:hypothetical protein
VKAFPLRPDLPTQSVIGGIAIGAVRVQLANSIGQPTGKLAQPKSAKRAVARGGQSLDHRGPDSYCTREDRESEGGTRPGPIRLGFWLQRFGKDTDSFTDDFYKEPLLISRFETQGEKRIPGRLFPDREHARFARMPNRIDAIRPASNFNDGLI